VKQGSCWILNGAKTFTTNAHYADVCVAMAVTDRAAAAHGISAFIIPKGTSGFRLGKKENKLGMRASATGEVIFQDCRLPESQLLGNAGEGFVDSLRILDGGRISIAALAVGWNGARRLRCGVEVFEAAETIRPADLRIPGDST
jgi:alkylation response protein AidB-like acyl-CoA dehydrogenase